VTSQAERTSPPDPGQESRVEDDRDAFAEMYDAHAQHIFDYCYSLLGDRARAASATQVTLIAAHSLASRLADTSRMRAFVLALARWECLSGGQGLPRAEGATSPDGSDDLAAALAFVDQDDDDIGDPGTGELTLLDFEASSGLSLRATLRALSREDQEILDLLYRHEVSVTDLAPLLGVSAASVPGMLAAAKAKFAAQARGAAPATAVAAADSPDVRAEHLSAVRLASLPASVWRRTARAVMDPRFRSYREAVSAHAEHLGPDGFPVQAAPLPSSRKLLMASALMAGLLLAPAAAGGVVYAAVSTLAHVVEHHHSTAVTPGGLSSGGSVTGGPADGPRSAGGARRAGSKGEGNPGAGLAALPRASTSRRRHHKASPSSVPTSRYSSPSSSPSQSSTSPGSPSPSPTTTPTSPTSSTTAAAAATPTAST
jgi:DNA-directed RNA polymerase specialized sigma24 family protein